MSLTVDALTVWLTKEQKAHDRRATEAKLLAQRGRDLKLEIADLEATLESIEEAIGILSAYADSRQADVQKKVESLITHGLRQIFDPDMSFHIKQATKGKLASADFVVRSKIDGGFVDTPIMDARGGGVASVAGFLLRLILLLLKKDHRPVLFLDETFAQLSAEYEPRLAEFVRELVDKTPVQVILVTHSTAYDDVADASYRFSLDQNGRTKVTPA